MRTLMENNCAVLISESVPAFSFFSIGYLFLDLSSSTMRKFYVTCWVRIFKIKEFAEFVSYILVNALAKFHGKL